MKLVKIVLPLKDDKVAKLPQRWVFVPWPLDRGDGSILTNIYGYKPFSNYRALINKQRNMSSRRSTVFRGIKLHTFIKPI